MCVNLIAKVTGWREREREREAERVGEREREREEVWVGLPGLARLLSEVNTTLRLLTTTLAPLPLSLSPLSLACCD